MSELDKFENKQTLNMELAQLFKVQFNLRSFAAPPFSPDGNFYDGLGIFRTLVEIDV